MFVGFHCRFVPHILTLAASPSLIDRCVVSTFWKGMSLLPTVWAGLQEVGGLPSLAGILSLRRSRTMKHSSGILCALLLLAGNRPLAAQNSALNGARVPSLDRTKSPGERCGRYHQGTTAGPRKYTAEARTDCGRICIEQGGKSSSLVPAIPTRYGKASRRSRRVQFDVAGEMAWVCKNARAGAGVFPRDKQNGCACRQASFHAGSGISQKRIREGSAA